MIYDYGCKKCKDTVEVRHGMNEKPEIKCDKCGGKRTKHFTTTYLHGINGGGSSGTPRR